MKKIVVLGATFVWGGAILIAHLEWLSFWMRILYGFLWMALSDEILSYWSERLENYEEPQHTTFKALRRRGYTVEGPAVSGTAMRLRKGKVVIEAIDESNGLCTVARRVN